LSRTQALWLLGNVAADAAASAEFIRAGGAAVLVGIVRRYAATPEEDPALLALVALTSLARHDSSALTRAGAVSAVAQCLAVAAAKRSTVAEPACAALGQVLLAGHDHMSVDSSNTCLELAVTGVVHSLTSLLDASLTSVTSGGDAGFDASLARYAAEALYAVLVCASGKVHAASAVSATAGDSSAAVLLAQATEASGPSAVVQSLLDALGRQCHGASQDGTAPEELQSVVQSLQKVSDMLALAVAPVQGALAEEKAPSSFGPLAAVQPVRQPTRHSHRHASAPTPAI
jgi:hypothetical protein